MILEAHEIKRLQSYAHLNHARFLVWLHRRKDTDSFQEFLSGRQNYYGMNTIDSLVNVPVGFNPTN
jgi:hypothetical protein